MMRHFSLKHWLALLLCFTLLLPNLAAAQRDDDIAPLTKTYVAPDKSFSFSYPQDWEIQMEGNNSVMFTVPLSSTGEPNDAGIAMQAEQMSITISIQEETPDTTAEDVVLAQAEPLAEGNDSFELTEVKSGVGNGRPNAFVAVIGTLLPLTNGFYAIDLSEENDLFMNFWLAGTGDQIYRIYPVMPLIFATLQMPANTSLTPVTDVELTQTFLADDWFIVFDYPEDWRADEQPNYVLLTAPNGVTMGISASPREPDEPAELEALVTARAEDSMALLTEALGEPVELPIQIIIVDDLPISRIDYMDGNFQYSFLSVPVTDTLIGNVTIIGDVSGVANLEPVISAIIASLRLLDEKTQSSGRDSASPNEILTYQVLKQLGIRPKITYDRKRESYTILMKLKRQIVDSLRLL